MQQQEANAPGYTEVAALERPHRKATERGRHNPRSPSYPCPQPFECLPASTTRYAKGPLDDPSAQTSSPLGWCWVEHRPAVPPTPYLNCRFMNKIKNCCCLNPLNSGAIFNISIVTRTGRGNFPDWLPAYLPLPFLVCSPDLLYLLMVASRLLVLSTHHILAF